MADLIYHHAQHYSDCNIYDLANLVGWRRRHYSCLYLSHHTVFLNILILPPSKSIEKVCSEIKNKERSEQSDSTKHIKNGTIAGKQVFLFTPHFQGDNSSFLFLLHIALVISQRSKSAHSYSTVSKVWTAFI